MTDFPIICNNNKFCATDVRRESVSVRTKAARETKKIGLNNWPSTIDRTAELHMNEEAQKIAKQLQIEGKNGF